MSRVKPDNRCHAADYVVSLAPHREAAAFIAAHHYAKGCSNTSVKAFSLTRHGVIVGAAVWLPPTRACAETVNRDHWRDVLALSRLVVLNGEPTNTESMFIGRMVRAIRREGRWKSLVTFADESQGHTGVIYRASNWTYIGRTKPEPRWVAEDGRQVSRLSTRTRSAGDMRAMGYVCSGRYAKHKFVMHIHADDGGVPASKATPMATRGTHLAR